MATWFELLYKVVAEFNKAFFFLFTGNLSMSISAMMAAAGSQVLKARWSKELNHNYVTAMCNTGEEIVHVNVRLN